MGTGAAEKEINWPERGSSKLEYIKREVEED